MSLMLFFGSLGVALWRLISLTKLKLTRLSEPAILNQYVQPVSLPTTCLAFQQECWISAVPKNISTPDNIWITDTQCIIHSRVISFKTYMCIDMKYGLLSDIKVLKAPVISDAACGNAFPGLITDTMFCLGNKNSCDIPRGAPADCNGELQGIFSWDHRWNCGLNNEGLGVFAKICNFNNWIQNTMAT